MADQQIGGLADDAAATVAIVGKIQGAMQFFGDDHVGNLILREGRPLEYETSMGGDVAIVHPTGESVEVRGDGLGDDVTTSSPAGSTLFLERDEMAALFDLVSRNWRAVIQQGAIDGPVRFDGMGRYRANIFLWGGESSDCKDDLAGRLGAMIRIIPDAIVPLQKLGLPTYMNVLADANCGLLLVAGPTGSGKTTTLAAFMDHINESRVGHIITIEDPIEYDMRERNCRVTPREVGTNVRDLETGVRDAMRELPLAIMVGEVRDAATLVQTIRAARSGHYVGTTRHAPNAVSAVRSLVEDLAGDQRVNAAMLAETLLGVIYQVRIPSMTPGQWEFAHEVLNISGSEEAQRLIAAMDWNGLRGYVESGEKAQSLNKALLELISKGTISADAADRRTYDRVCLRKAQKPGTSK